MAIRPPLALIAGPTASGKSRLALRLAEATGGAIVNADSAQLYRDLPILSAAPTAADRARADHRLYQMLDGANACSAAEWAALAQTEIAAIHADGRLPILVGGTGLYLRTLLEGIAPIPTIDPEIRREVRNASLDVNWEALQGLDPEAAARLNPGDSARVARALEVMRSTGRPLAEWQRERSGGIGASVDLRPLLLLPPRDWLYRRCDDRFAEMVEQGAIAEVRALIARQLPPSLPVMRAIGVREIGRFLAGETDLAAAISAGQQSTRRYGKRQFTWFAHQPPADWPRFAEPLFGKPAEDAALVLLAGER